MQGATNDHPERLDYQSSAALPFRVQSFAVQEQCVLRWSSQ